MTRSRILRLPCGEAESGNFVLEAKSNGSKPLDLLIRGTDGASAFETKSKQPAPLKYIAHLIISTCSVIGMVGSAMIDSAPDLDPRSSNSCVT